jgi:hypothetical protein
VLATSGVYIRISLLHQGYKYRSPEHAEPSIEVAAKSPRDREYVSISGRQVSHTVSFIFTSFRTRHGLRNRGM